METVKEKDLDIMIKFLAFYRDKGRDQYTGLKVGADFQPHHFIHRQSKYFRWRLDNVFTVSKSSHFLIHHGQEGLFGSLMEKQYPDRINKLRQEKWQVHRWYKSDFNEVYNEIRRDFEVIFGSFNDFKKLSVEERYLKALKIIDEKGR